MASTIWNWMNADNTRSSGPGIRIAAGAGLVLAYTMSIRLKTLGYLPPTVTWAGVALLPALMFLAIGSIVVLPMKTTRQRVVMVTVSAVSYLTGLGVVYWQGWV